MPRVKRWLTQVRLLVAQHADWLARRLPRVEHLPELVNLQAEAWDHAVEGANQRLPQATELATATSVMPIEGPASLGAMARLLVAESLEGPSVNRQSPELVLLLASRWRNSRAAAPPGNDQPWLAKRGAHVLD